MPEFNWIYGDAAEYKTMAQAFVEAGNLGGTTAKAWAGRRYHKRRDVNINDYFYMSLKGGANTIALQYGKGAARSPWNTAVEGGSALGRLTSAAAADALEAAKTWRLVDYHLYEGERWAMQSAFIRERRQHATFDGTGLSLGARPMLFLGGHWRLVGEAGHDRVSNHAAHARGAVWKFTAAMEWAPRRVFLSRPALRVYLTRAGWSEEFRGRAGAPIFNDDTRGWNAGVQVETSW